MENRKGAYLLIAPTALVFALLFVASFAYFVVISFWTVERFKLTPAFTLDNYVAAFTLHSGSAWFTSLLAVIIATLTTVLGFVYAYLIRFKAGHWGPVFLFIAVVTLFGGYLMKIYAWRTILGTEGVLNTALMSTGLIDEPITVLLFSPPAVVLTLVHFLLPFAILPVYAALRGIADIEIEAARDLGAQPWKILRDVVIPRARSGLVAAFALCLLVAIGDYVTPILVGGTMSMFGQMIAPTFGNFMNWPLGAAMSISILLVALLLVVLANALLARIGRPS